MNKTRKILSLLLAIVTVSLVSVPGNTAYAAFSTSGGYTNSEWANLCTYSGTYNGYNVYYAGSELPAGSSITYTGTIKYGYITGGMGNPSILMDFYQIVYNGTTYYIPDWDSSNFSKN